MNQKVNFSSKNDDLRVKTASKGLQNQTKGKWNI